MRVDTHLQAGATVPPYYDSLLAKVIARGADRRPAPSRYCATPSDRCAVDGVTTNLDLHRALLADPEFAAGGVDTGYLARWLAAPCPGGSAKGLDRPGRRRRRAETRRRADRGSRFRSESSRCRS